MSFDPPKHRKQQTVVSPSKPTILALSVEGLASRLRDVSIAATDRYPALCISILLDRRGATAPITITVTPHDGLRGISGNDSKYVELLPLPMADVMAAAMGIWSRMLSKGAEAGLNPSLLDDGLLRLIERTGRQYGCSSEELKEIKKIAVADQPTARMCFLALERETLGPVSENTESRLAIPSIADAVDERIRCGDCAGLNGNGGCVPASQGRLGSSWRYSPMQDILRRCGAFIKKGSAPSISNAQKERADELVQNAAVKSTPVKGAFKVGRR